MLKEILINDKCKLEERKNQITTELCQLKKALEENQNKSNEPRYRSPFIGDLTRGTF